MRYLSLLRRFISVSTLDELAYRTNFWIRLLHSVLNLGTGVLGVVVLYGQVESLRGWSLSSTLALLGVYLIVVALRGLVIGPSLDSLAGMEGELWTGRFDFTLLRPVDTQFLVSLRQWRPLALIDLTLGLGVLVTASVGLGAELSAGRVVAFLVALAIGVAILYAILLAFAAMVVWSPRLFFTWAIDAVFQMARYPVGLYPGWLRLVLTWVVPVGIIITTVPAQALTGTLAPGMLAGSAVLAVALLVGSSALFRAGLTRYASASS